MSLKGLNTTADYLNWNDMLILLQKLERDRLYLFAMLIATGCYTGLRISDLLTLRWSDLIGHTGEPSIELTEKKTKKRRRIKLNADLLELAKRLYSYSRALSPEQLIFLNPKTKRPFSIQYLNRKLKVFRYKYRLSIKNFSTHAFRKTFGRHIWENSGYSEKAITLLSEIFNHSSYRITRRYLGINEDDIDGVYDLL